MSPTVPRYRVDVIQEGGISVYTKRLFSTLANARRDPPMASGSGAAIDREVSRITTVGMVVIIDAGWWS